MLNSENTIPFPIIPLQQILDNTLSMIKSQFKYLDELAAFFKDDIYTMVKMHTQLLKICIDKIILTHDILVFMDRPPELIVDPYLKCVFSLNIKDYIGLMLNDLLNDLSMVNRFLIVPRKTKDNLNEKE